MLHDGDMTNTPHTRNTANRRLQRTHEDRILAGVSTGLGDYLEINSWWIRLAFIILTVFGGAGVLVYVAAWLVIPDEREDEAIITGWMKRLDTSDGGMIFGFVLIGAAALIVLSQIADVSGAIVVAVVLFVAGILLYRGDVLLPKPTDPPPAAPSDEDQEAGMEDTPTDDTPIEPEGEDALIASSSTSAALVDTGPVSPPPPPPKSAPLKPTKPKTPREHSMLGRITLAVGLIVLAGIALADQAFSSIDAEPVHYFGAALGIVGLGLLVGSLIGRARWLIFVGFLLLPALWFTSFWPANFEWSAGERRHEPISVDEVQDEYALGMGSMRVDLTGLSPAELGEVGKISASVGMGELIVYLPEDVTVRMAAEVAAGEIKGPFETTNGMGLERIAEFGSGTDTLVLDLEVGFGVINIRGPIADEGWWDNGEASVESVVAIDWSNS